MSRPPKRDEADFAVAATVVVALKGVGGAVLEVGQRVVADQEEAVDSAAGPAAVDQVVVAPEEADFVVDRVGVAEGFAARREAAEAFHQPICSVDSMAMETE